MNHLPERHQITGLGELLWDILPEGPRLGGAPANFIYNISRFGLNSTLVSAIGNDEAGSLAVEELNKLEVPGFLATVPHPTGKVDVNLDGAGVPVYDIRKPAAWDLIPMGTALRRLAHRTTVACFGTLAQRSPVSRATINMFLDTMPDGRGRLKVFDINLRSDYYSKEVIVQSLMRCNILKINNIELSEVAAMLGYKSVHPEEICHRLMHDYSLECLALTCGESGSYIFGKSTMSYLPAPKVKVEDTVGAGDSFTAAMIASLLRGESIEEAHRLAVEVSAFVCTQKGAMTPLPASLTAR